MTPLDPPARPVRWRRPDSWHVATLAIAALVALPVVTVLAAVFVPAPEIWGHLAQTVLPRYLINTAILVAGVAAGTLVIGVGTAWLVAMCRFPGRQIFEWALLLPFAVPGFVIAYAYTDFLQYAGPVQSWLRAAFGWGSEDYWFPPIRSRGGAVAMLTLTLYPYVYLIARTAFLEQSVCALEVGRTLGHGPWRIFSRVALPLARPSIAGGLALALMETLNDFGTVRFFGVATFVTGIERVGFGMGERVAAAQLAAILLLFVLAVILLERLSRGRAGYSGTSQRQRSLPAYRLHGRKAVLASLACGLPVLLGFLLPAGLLAEMAWRHGYGTLAARFAQHAANSFTLAAVGAVMAVAVALVLGYGVRLRPGRTTRLAARVAAMGYAVPGAVIAVGVLIPFTALETTVDGWLRSTLGISSGLFLTGSIAGLVFAYVVRFLAVSFNTVEASLARITGNMEAAARTLGHGSLATLVRIHIPMMRGSLAAAGLLVFVDIMKELPATLILRPFNFDTLAVRAHQLASDERLSQAAGPALAIVLVGILPVILLSRTLARSRPAGSEADAL